PLLARLHDIGTESDRSKNRRLFFDNYAALILLAFFSPSLGSLRALQQASCLVKVQTKLGSPRTSLGALSAAARDFDAAALPAARPEDAARASCGSAAKRAAAYSSRRSPSWRSRPASAAGTAAPRCCCWPALGWNSRPPGAPAVTSIAGPWNSFAAGSSGS